MWFQRQVRVKSRISGLKLGGGSGHGGFIRIIREIRGQAFNDSRDPPAIASQDRLFPGRPCSGGNGGLMSCPCRQEHLPSPTLPSIRWRGGSRILRHDNPGLLSRCSFTLGYDISPLTGLGIRQYPGRGILAINFLGFFLAEELGNMGPTAGESKVSSLRSEVGLGKRPRWVYSDHS